MTLPHGACSAHLGLSWLLLSILLVGTDSAEQRNDKIIRIGNSDAACYAGRYPNLAQEYCGTDFTMCKEKELYSHFLTHGKFQNLIWECPTDRTYGKVTDALCYAKRYPDLLNTFCDNDIAKCNNLQLLFHYRDHGKFEHRIWQCPTETSPPTKSSSRLGIFDLALLRTKSFIEPLALQVLIYESEEASDSIAQMLQHQSFTAGIETSIFGQGTEFRGYSSKYKEVMPLLERMRTDALVVIADSRDLLLNIRNGNDGRHAVESFKNAYRALTLNSPGAIVLSAEAQCCVSALSHAQPGDYFDASSGHRRNHACSSGTKGCLWAGDDFLLPWTSFMHDLAKNRTGINVEDPYLNAGLMAGRPGDLLRVFEAMMMEEQEDDQALLTDFMYSHPSSIVLDYAQEMFGNNRWAEGMDAGCVFDSELKSASGSLVHQRTHTEPLFIHSPGKFFECHDKLARRLGLVTRDRTKDAATRRQLPGNYGTPICPPYVRRTDNEVCKKNSYTVPCTDGKADVSLLVNDYIYLGRVDGQPTLPTCPPHGAPVCDETKYCHFMYELSCCDVSQTYQASLQPGDYEDYDVGGPYTGLMREDGTTIGEWDDVTVFQDEDHPQADRVWFTEGWMEWKYDVDIPPNSAIRSFSYTIEMSSEHPGSNINWPSPVSVDINNVNIGSWTLPGDPGPDIGFPLQENSDGCCSQFGWFTTWTVDRTGTYLEHMFRLGDMSRTRISDVTIGDIGIMAGGHTTVKLSVSKTASGAGLHIYGDTWGDYDEDPSIEVVYTP